MSPRLEMCPVCVGSARASRWWTILRRRHLWRDVADRHSTPGPARHASRRVGDGFGVPPPICPVFEYMDVCRHPVSISGRWWPTVKRYLVLHFPARSTHFLHAECAQTRLQRMAHAARMGRGLPKWEPCGVKFSCLTFPRYWTPTHANRRLEALAALGLRRARVATLIMWKSDLRVSETKPLEWRDVHAEGGTPLVRRGKGARAALFHCTPT